MGTANNVPSSYRSHRTRTCLCEHVIMSRFLLYAFRLHVCLPLGYRGQDKECSRCRGQRFARLLRAYR
jgi:hypothetical protein